MPHSSHNEDLVFCSSSFMTKLLLKQHLCIKIPDVKSVNMYTLLNISSNEIFLLSHID